ncbi:MAG: hypothetical protein RR526_01325 [Victivallaceae bacterium]
MSGSINPIDEPERVRSADLSTLGMQGRNISLPTNASPADKVNLTQSISDLQNLRGARTALENVLASVSSVDNMSTSSNVAGIAAPLASTPTEEAQKQALLAQQALADLKAAKTLAEVTAAYTALKNAADAAQQAAALSGDDPAAISANQQAATALIEGTKVYNAVNAALKAQTDAEDALVAMQKATSWAAVETALKKAQAAVIAAQKAVKDSGSHPLAVEALKTTKVAASSAQALSDQLKVANDALEAAKNAASSVSGSSSQGELSQQIQVVRQELAKAQSVLEAYPDNPLAQNAVASINNVLTDLQKLYSDLQGIISGIVSGGSAESTQQAAVAQTAAGLRNLSFLSESDNTTSRILMNGFRQMIRQFYDDSPNFRPDLQGVIDKLDPAALGLSGDNQEFIGLSKGIGDLKQKLIGILGQGGTAESKQQAIMTMLSSVASLTGTSPTIAAQLMQTTQAILGFGFGLYTQMAMNVSSLPAFVNNLNNVNRLYPRLNSVVQSMVNTALTPASQAPLVSPAALQKAVNSPGVSPNLVAMQNALAMSGTAGQMARVVLMAEQAMTIAKANSNMSVRQVADQLTKNVSKAPEYGYPYMQVPGPSSTGDLVAKLTEDFVQGNRTSAESKKNRFENTPFFVQQFYVNIASLLPFMRNG